MKAKNTSDKFKSLLANDAVRAELEKNPPRSKFSGKPLTLVGDGYGMSLEWGNGTEPDWWVGQQDGIYTKQDRRPVTDDAIRAAALAAGLSETDIELAFMSRVQELAALDAERKQYADEYFKAEAAGRAKRLAESRAKLLAASPWLDDKTLAAAAENELDQLIAKHPGIVRMTRKLSLLDKDDNAIAHFTNLNGMKAWLFQHGFRVSIDDRHEFVKAAF